MLGVANVSVALVAADVVDVIVVNGVVGIVDGTVVVVDEVGAVVVIVATGGTDRIIVLGVFDVADATVVVDATEIVHASLCYWCDLVLLAVLFIDVIVAVVVDAIAVIDMTSNADEISA